MIRSARCRGGTTLLSRGPRGEAREVRGAALEGHRMHREAVIAMTFGFDRNGNGQGAGGDHGVGRGRAAGRRPA